MDAKGRAALGEVLIHHSGLAPPADGADLTSLQVRQLFCLSSVYHLICLDNTLKHALDLS